MHGEIGSLHNDIYTLNTYCNRFVDDIHNHINSQKFEVCGMVTENVKRLFTVYSQNQVFSKFKGIHFGQNIIIVGAGPSVNKFKPIENAVYIGLNRAFKFSNIKFDYLFAIDKMGIEDYYYDFFSYRNGQCIKFVGDQNNGKDYQIPESVIKGENIYRYITSTGHFSDKLAYHIDSQPLGNFVSVSLQAVQFALYTNPSRIYLVGIDCTANGHFIGEENYTEKRDIKEAERNANQSIEDWKKVKDFVATYYPGTEIISVNPVGLKGIFKDWYQDDGEEPI